MASDPNVFKSARLVGMLQEFFSFQPRVIGPDGLFRTGPDLYTSSEQAEVDVETGTRTIAEFKGADSPAGVKAQIGKTRKKINTVRFREKVRLKPSTTRLLDAVGKKGVPERLSALIAKELADLDRMAARTFEALAWDLAIDGAATVTVDGVSETYDFGMPSAHKITLAGGAKWDAPTTCDPIGDLAQYADLTSQNGDAEATEVYMSTTALRKIFASTAGLAQLDEVTKGIFARTLRVPELGNLQMNIVNYGYLNSSAVYTRFLPEDQILIVAQGDGGPGEFHDGLCEDLDAPDNTSGVFS